MDSNVLNLLNSVFSDDVGIFDGTFEGILDRGVIDGFIGILLIGIFGILLKGVLDVSPFGTFD